MKKPGKTCGKAGSTPHDITRHYTKLRPEETRYVVERLADLIVDIVKLKGVDSVKDRTQIHASSERSIPEPLRDGRNGASAAPYREQTVEIAREFHKLLG